MTRCEDLSPYTCCRVQTAAEPSGRNRACAQAKRLDSTVTEIRRAFEFDGSAQERADRAGIRNSNLDNDSEVKSGFALRQDPDAPGRYGAARRIQAGARFARFLSHRIDPVRGNLPEPQGRKKDQPQAVWIRATSTNTTLDRRGRDHRPFSARSPALALPRRSPRAFRPTAL